MKNDRRLFLKKAMIAGTIPAVWAVPIIKDIPPAAARDVGSNPPVSSPPPTLPGELLPPSRQQPSPQQPLTVGIGDLAHTGNNQQPLVVLGIAGVVSGAGLVYMFNEQREEA